MNIESDLHDIAQVISEQYPATYPSGTPRHFHGMEHVSRASIFGSAAYNLLALANIQGAAALTLAERQNEIKLIQIALLLHDSAREAEGKDYWDDQSALNLFNFLTEKLGVPPETAKMTAEAMANKDWEQGEEYSSIDFDNPPASIQKNKKETPLNQQTERMRLAVQFGDCIDIYRIPKKNFDWSYIKLYNMIEHPQLVNAIEHMIPECFELIEKTKNQNKEQHWAVPEMYGKIMREFNRDDGKAYPMLHALSQPDPNATFASLPQEEDQIVENFIHQNLLFRGISDTAKRFTRRGARKQKTYPEGYTQAMQEVRKVARTPDKPTSARTEEKRLGKLGNPSRSMSLLGQGGLVFSGVGAGLFLRKEHLISANPYNIGSGFGPKHDYDTTPRGDLTQIDPGLEAIKQMMRSGESMATESETGHSEILGDMNAWDCVMYSVDELPKDKRSPRERLLEAIHLRDAYQKEFNQQTPLPIYEFSTKMGFCRPIQVTEELVLETFKDLLTIDIERTMENLTNIGEIDWVSRMLDSGNILDLLNRFHSEFLISMYPVKFQEKILSYLLDQKNTFRRAVNESVMKKQIPSGKVEDSELSFYLTLLKMQAEMGVTFEKIPGFFSQALRGYFVENSPLKNDLWLQAFVSLAGNKKFPAEIYLYSVLKKLSIAHLDDYLQMIEASKPDEKTRISMKRSLQEAIEREVTRIVQECLARGKVSALFKIDDLLREGGHIQIGKFFTQEMYEETIRALQAKRETLIDAPLHQHLRALAFYEHGSEDALDLDVDSLKACATLFDSIKSTAYHVPRNVFIHLCKDDTNSEAQSKRIDNLIELCQSYPATYGVMIREQFADLINNINVIPMRLAPYSSTPNPLSQADNFFKSMKAFTNLGEEQQVNLYSRLIMQMLETNVSEQIFRDEKKLAKYLKYPINDLLILFGSPQLGNFYTADIREKVLKNVEQRRGESLGSIFNRYLGANEVRSIINNGKYAIAVDRLVCLFHLNIETDLAGQQLSFLLKQITYPPDQICNFMREHRQEFCQIFAQGEPKQEQGSSTLLLRQYSESVRHKSPAEEMIDNIIHAESEEQAVLMLEKLQENLPTLLAKNRSEGQALDH